MCALRYRDKAFPEDWRYTILSIPLELKNLDINGYEYHFKKKLGNGSFGAVYAANRCIDNKPVAIKVVSLATRNCAISLQNSEAVLNEIEMARRLARTSNHIVHMYDFDFHRHTGLSFIVMELGQQDLERYLSARTLVAPLERKSIWRQLVDIAVTLHIHNIVHFDIKPQNLVVFSTGLVKLVDLGIAQKAFEKRIGPNGSAPYSAPEVTLISRRHVTINTTKADVWSWGAVLYRMTYMTNPEYNEPCYQPPINQYPTRDPHLRDVLQHTLIIDPSARPDPLWFIKHPFTRIL